MSTGRFSGAINWGRVIQAREDAAERPDLSHDAQCAYRHKGECDCGKDQRQECPECKTLPDGTCEPGCLCLPCNSTEGEA